MDFASVMEWNELKLDRPWALLILLWPLLAWALLRRKKRLPGIGGQPRSNFTFWFLALELLVIGLAGPRWGKSRPEGVAVGRDMILVIDFSRSMLATDLKQPIPRWKAAVEAAEEWIRAVSLRGGHRVGIVVFAAKPKLLVPLTTDYAHALQVLGELDGGVRPLEIRPDENDVSGTRIGDALKLALDSHDARYPGMQDIILFSDGDDPAEDREWASAIPKARQLGIPVFTVGFGSLDETPLVLKKRGDAEGELISTMFRADVLAEIARETRGLEIPAGRDTPAMSEFFHRTLEPLPARLFNDDAVTLRQDRSAPFLAVGMLFFLLAWWKGPI